MKRFFQLGTTKIDGLTYHSLKGEPKPQNPTEFSAKGMEFHDRIKGLKGDTAIDIGANIGSYTIRLAGRFRKVVAFEPSPAHCRVLRINASINNFHNIYVEEMALSDSTGTRPLYIRRGGGATSLDSSHYGLGYDRVVSVRTEKLDNYLDRLGKVDFVKLDAESHELKILVGGRVLIATSRPILAVEVHRASLPAEDSCSCAFSTLIRSLGYVVEVTGEFSSTGDVHWIWASPS